MLAARSALATKSLVRQLAVAPPPCRCSPRSAFLVFIIMAASRSGSWRCGVGALCLDVGWVLMGSTASPPRLCVLLRVDPPYPWLPVPVVCRPELLPH